MIFLTVGSSLPFDRLIQTVDAAVGEGMIAERVFAQIGNGQYLPRNMEFDRFLPKDTYDAWFSSSSAVISHAGIGTISAANTAGKPILVMPRLKQYGELVDDHQLKTAQRFAALGHVLSFSNLDELQRVLPLLSTFEPRPRMPNSEGVALAIREYLIRNLGGYDVIDQESCSS